MNERIRIRVALIFTAFGLFASIYLFKEATLVNRLLGIGGLLLSCSGYLYTIHQTRSTRLPRLKFVLLTALLLRIVALPIPIMWDDLFYRTLWNGWIFASGVNPYLHVPSSDMLVVQQSSTLYDLIRQIHAHTSVSPLYQLLMAPFGWLFDRAGLSTGVLSLKGTSILLDLGILALLHGIINSDKAKAAPLLHYAWNPMLIFFITSQGLLLQLPVLLFLLFYRSWNAGYKSLAGLSWGGLMLSSPVGWLGLPYLWRRIGYRLGWIPLAVFLISWIPFYDPALFSEIIQGLQDAWQYPEPQLSLGYLGVFGLTSLTSLAGWYWTAAVALTLFLMAAFDAFGHPPPNSNALWRQLLILGLLYFLLSPATLLGLAALLLVICSIRGRLLTASALLSSWYLLEHWFFVHAGWMPVIVFFSGLIGTGALLLLFPDNRLSQWVKQ